MEENKKKDNSLLFGCGGIVLFCVILTVIGIVGTLIFNGKQGANAMFNRDENNPIDILRGGAIILAVIGVIFFIRRQSK